MTYYLDREFLDQRKKTWEADPEEEIENKNRW